MMAKVLLTVALPICSFYSAREVALRAHGTRIDPVSPATQSEPAPLTPVDRDAPPPDEKPRPFAAALPSTPPPAPAAVPAPAPAKTTLATDTRDRFDSDPVSSPSAERPVRHTPVLPEPPLIVPDVAAPSVPHIVSSQPGVARRSPERVVAYYNADPPPASIRHTIQKVFTGHSASAGFVAANPVEAPLPSPPVSAEPLEEGGTIEMLAKVDRLGNVVDVKVVDGNRQLAGLSTDALFRWRFDPARRNGAPIDSAML
jgi:hypothetical protein